MKNRLLVVLLALLFVHAGAPAQNLKELLELGQAQFNSGDHKACLETCEKALEKDPENLEVLILRGSLFVVNRLYKSGYKDLTFAIEHKTRNANAYLYRGKLFNKVGQYENALADVEQGLKLDPKLPELYQERMGLRILKGDMSGAKEDAERLVKLAPDLPITYYLRGMLYLMEGDLAHGKADLDRTLAMHTRDSSGVFFILGVYYQGVDNLGEAKSCFLKALDADPGNSRALASLVAIQLSEGDTVGSLRTMDRAIAADSSDAEIWTWKATFLRELGKSAEALPAANKAVSLGGEYEAKSLAVRANVFFAMDLLDKALVDINKALAKEPELVMALAIRAKVRKALGNYDQAIADIKKARELDPDSPSHILDLGVAYLEDKQYENARSLLKMFVSRVPDHPSGWVSLGTAEVHSGNPKPGIDAYTKALALGTNDSASVYYSRAGAYLDMKQLDQANADIDSCLAQRSMNPTVLLSLGYFLNELGRYQEALLHLDKAIALDSTYAYSFNNRGLARYKLGQYEAAISDFDKSIALKNDYYHWPPRNRGNALRALGRYKEAIEDYNLSLSYKEDYVEAITDRGETWELMGEREKAIADYQKALQFQPDYEPAKANLARLQK